MSQSTSSADPAADAREARLPRFLPQLRKGTGTLALAALAAALVWGGAQLLAARAAARPGPPPAPPVTVTAAAVVLQPHHEISVSFTGRIEAPRRVELGFEAGGTLAEIRVEEGDAVPAGAVLARLDIRALQAERAGQVAALAVLDARIELAELNVARARVLVDREFISTQRADEARLGLAEVRAERLRVEAAILALDVALDKAVLRAPFAARIGARMFDEGARIGAGQPVLTAFEGGPPLFRAGLPPELAAALPPGSAVTLDLGGVSLPAKVKHRRSDIDLASRTIPILFEVPGAAGLAEGMLGKLTLTRSVPGQGAWLPRAALSEGVRGLWTVFLVVDRPEGLFTRREAVELLHAETDRVFVRGAFPTGARVVLSGPHRLADGQAVVLAGAR
ncbi:MAG: efflux RND transporter periplasmic adaptor subunit [Betaproteobacteria bacterium]|jgi:RND family efflux transporter MFP subunit|nr:efflux RND transporter periplasmic adaptor subunit [Rubrivivax sp.]MCZ8176716.1 efflux RND transporter periplasmic adaptor subunit [Burkholderiaceae bacterium]